jgi:dynein heavy chain
VNCGGRRLSCHPNFKLYLLTSSHAMSFTPEIASITTLVNFTLENESFAEEILSLSLSRVQPEMSQESKKTMNALMENLVILEDLDSKIITRLSHRQGTNVWDDTELIADMVQCRAQVRICLLLLLLLLLKIQYFVDIT